MGLKSKNLDRVLEVVYEHPGKMFTIRELANATGIPRATVHSYLAELKKQGLVTKENRPAETGLFKTKKAFFFAEKLITSGLIDFIIKELNPSCIILFGSVRKGESVRDSDIDLFIETPIKKDLHIEIFEKKLKHPLQLFIHKDIHELPPKLFNNIVNGIKLYGSFKAK